nr:alpha,alpha-trehalose-phosphate synthase [UDP-forming] 6-like [Tanacetum cinerariifolium]
IDIAYGVLRRFLPEEKVESVRGLALTIDKRCVVFDVAADDLDTYLAVRLVVVRHIQLSNESTKLLQSLECCLVTTVRDEMNLIPYEYVINRQGSDRPDNFLGLDSSRLKKSIKVGGGKTYSTVKRINETFAKPGYQPIILIDKPLTFYERVAYYVVAECCLVTAVRDEMNLIPYEYVINRQGSDRPDNFLGLDSSRLKKSMLVISEF